MSKLSFVIFKYYMLCFFFKAALLSLDIWLERTLIWCLEEITMYLNLPADMNKLADHMINTTEVQSHMIY